MQEHGVFGLELSEVSWRRGRIFRVTKGPCPQFRAPSPPWSPRGLPRWPLNHCQLIKEVGQLHQAQWACLGGDFDLAVLYCEALLLS